MKILRYIINKKVVTLGCIILLSLPAGLNAQRTHKVKKGDSLYSIAKKYHLDVDELKRLNNMSSNKLKPGQKLVVEEKKKSKKKKPATQQERVQQRNQEETEDRAETTSRPTVQRTEKQYHKVKKGDTLSSISRRYGITVDQLKKLNKLRKKKLKIGQRLIVGESTTSVVQEQPEELSQPVRLAEKYHVVKKGQTLYSISKTYNIDVVDLLDYNNISGFEIKEGQRIWLEPGHLNAQAEQEQVPAGQTAETSAPQIAVHIVSRGENLFRIAKNYNVKVEDIKKWNNLSTLTVKEGQSLYIGDPSLMTSRDIEYTKQNRQVIRSFSRAPMLPLASAKVISEFGMRRGRMHKGLDFGAPKGEPIYAVLPGKVVFAGIQRGYGNVIIIEHDNFVMTVYGHNESNLVKLGDEVTQGQIIGTVGDTGNADGTHLHFEYRVRGVAIDPRDFLTGLPR